MLLDDGDFASMAEWQSLDEEIGYAAEEALRFERLPETPTVVLVHYRLPIAYYLAMELAEPDHGDGLVEVEGEWWDPRTYKQL